MVALILALVLAPAKTDLKAHFIQVHGRRELAVSRAQWNGIRKALFDRDRATLAALVSDRHGVTAVMRSIGRFRDPWSRKLSKAQFLDIGLDDAYSMGDQPSVSTADQGNTIYFKWLWIDVASVEKKTKVDWSTGRAYDRRGRPNVWELHGSIDTDVRHPARIVFGAERGKLVIRKVFVNFEPD